MKNEESFITILIITFIDNFKDAEHLKIFIVLCVCSFIMPQKVVIQDFVIVRQPITQYSHSRGYIVTSLDKIYFQLHCSSDGSYTRFHFQSKDALIANEIFHKVFDT